MIKIMGRAAAFIFCLTIYANIIIFEYNITLENRRRAYAVIGEKGRAFEGHIPPGKD